MVSHKRSSIGRTISQVSKWSTKSKGENSVYRAQHAPVKRGRPSLHRQLSQISQWSMKGEHSSLAKLHSSIRGDFEGAQRRAAASSMEDISILGHHSVDRRKESVVSIFSVPSNLEELSVRKKAPVFSIPLSIERSVGREVSQTSVASSPHSPGRRKMSQVPVFSIPGHSSAGRRVSVSSIPEDPEYSIERRASTSSIPEDSEHSVVRQVSVSSIPEDSEYSVGRRVSVSSCIPEDCDYSIERRVSASSIPEDSEYSVGRKVSVSSIHSIPMNEPSSGRKILQTSRGSVNQKYSFSTVPSIQPEDKGVKIHGKRTLPDLESPESISSGRSFPLDGHCSVPVTLRSLSVPEKTEATIFEGNEEENNVCIHIYSSLYDCTVL